MAKRIRVLQLSPKSVQNMIDFLEADLRGRRQNEIVLDFYSKIKDELVSIIRNNIDKYVEQKLGYDGTGMLKSGISADINSQTMELVISTDNDVPMNYAAYVEFGTGVVGKRGTKSRIMNRFGWIHDINSHGDVGWVYFDRDNNKFRWTAGQEAARFMEFSVLDIDEFLMKKYETYVYEGGKK